VGDARASAEERVAVYAYMYRARIAEALESQFPRLARHLGPDDFAELAAAYIADEPSTHPSLRFIGEKLPAWLQSRRPDAPSLAALARLEWVRTDVFDLADEPTLTLEALQAWPPERFAELPLRLVEAHRLVTVPAGTGALWDAIGPHDVADVALPSQEIPATGVETLLVWREATFVYHRFVDPVERAALELAASGTRFGVVCDALLARFGEEESARRAFSWLATWLADGLVRSVD
jgi:hypothetical protein